MNARLRVRFEKLESVRRGIEARLGSLSADVANRPPSPGSWSAAQVIEHIVASESRSVDYIRKKSSDPAALRRAGIPERIKGWLVVAAMGLPIRVKAPAIVAAVPEQVDPVELCERWARVRDDMRSLLDAIPDELLTTCIYKHPVGGRLTLAAALDFMIAHAARHARQIDSTIREVGNR